MLRDKTGLPSLEKGSYSKPIVAQNVDKVFLLLLDLPRDGSYYKMQLEDGQEVSESLLWTFLEDWKQGRLEHFQMKK
jgi:hypothetical protein